MVLKAEQKKLNSERMKWKIYLKKVPTGESLKDNRKERWREADYRVHRFDVC